jgi:hypothetical protein
MKNLNGTNNRRMILSADMLIDRQQEHKRVSLNDVIITPHNSKETQSLYEYDDNPIYELGYN